MLNTAPHLRDPDAAYAALVDAHRDLSPEQSRQLNARLILLLLNHIGDRAVLDAAIARASRDLRAPTPDRDQ